MHFHVNKVRETVQGLHGSVVETISTDVSKLDYILV